MDIYTACYNILSIAMDQAFSVSPCNEISKESLVKSELWFDESLLLVLKISFAPTFLEKLLLFVFCTQFDDLIP